MALGISFARQDGSPEIGTVPAVQTTLVAGTTELTGSHNVVVPVAGSTAVRLPMRAAAPITVVNHAATAVTLLVFPPWNTATSAAAGGKINNGSADASFSVAQNKSAMFIPHPNGVDYTAILSA